MKFAIHIAAILIVCFLLQYFLPWWSMAIGAAIVGFASGNSALKSFAAGLIGVGLLWFFMALYIDVATDSILTAKVEKILPLHPFILTVLIGGLVGGLASLTGALARSFRS